MGTRAGGQKIRHWKPFTKPKPKQTKAIELIREALSDGNEHTATELKELFAKADVGWRYACEAKKFLGDEVLINNRGRGGALWRWRHAEAPHEVKKAENPMAAKSAALIKEHGPATKAPLRERVEEAVPGYDPVVSIAQIANDPSVPIAVRLECHRDVAKYMVPQVKATEITTDDQPIALSFRWQE